MNTMMKKNTMTAKTTKDERSVKMALKIRRKGGNCECPICGYIWEGAYELKFDEDERVLTCPECGEPIEDGDDDD